MNIMTLIFVLYSEITVVVMYVLLLNKHHDYERKKSVEILELLKEKYALNMMVIEARKEVLELTKEINRILKEVPELNEENIVKEREENEWKEN